MNTALIDVHQFDLFKLPGDFHLDPYPYFRELRNHSPVHRLSDGSYLVCRYNDNVAIYRNPRLWSSDKKVDFKPKLGGSPLYEHHTTSVVFQDPPDHTRIRKLFQAAFTRKALAALEPRIEILVDGYLDRLEDQRKMEIVAEFSFQLPVEVVCDMLGVPSKDRHLLRDWAIAILTGLEPTLSPAEFESGCKAVDEFKAYLRELIAYRKSHPTDGASGEILTALIDAEDDGESLTELELLHQCIFLLNAGHETSTNFLSHGIHELLRNPDQKDRLVADPSMIDTCVEEVLRYQAPIQINNRRATEDATVGNTSLAEGTTVHLLIGSANHDPEEFDDPEQFDIGRKSNRHLSFGLGIHTCAGNSLARMEGKIAFGKLFSRFPKLRLEAPPELSTRVRFREIKHLPVSL